MRIGIAQHCKADEAVHKLLHVLRGPCRIAVQDAQHAGVVLHHVFAVLVLGRVLQGLGKLFHVDALAIRAAVKALHGQYLVKRHLLRQIGIGTRNDAGLGALQPHGLAELIAGEFIGHQIGVAGGG